jgi:hypothetical protein
MIIIVKYQFKGEKTPKKYKNKNIRYSNTRKI